MRDRLDLRIPQRSAQDGREVQHHVLVRLPRLYGSRRQDRLMIFVDPRALGSICRVRGRACLDVQEF